MPSYYDSTKKKPGKAKLRYNEGGKTSKVPKAWIGDGGRAVTKEDRRRDAQIKKELQESIALLRREGKFQRMSAADRAARNKKEEAAWEAEREKSEAKEKEKIAREKALAAAYKRHHERVNPSYVYTPKEKHAKESGRGGFKHGGRVTRPIDGRATKGLTRGSGRT